jgi:hypothetical protein
MYAGDRAVGSCECQPWPGWQEYAMVEVVRVENRSLRRPKAPRQRQAGRVHPEYHFDTTSGERDSVER